MSAKVTVKWQYELLSGSMVWWWDPDDVSHWRLLPFDKDWLIGVNGTFSTVRLYVLKIYSLVKRLISVR